MNKNKTRYIWLEKIELKIRRTELKLFCFKIDLMLIFILLFANNSLTISILPFSIAICKGVTLIIKMKNCTMHKTIKNPNL